MANKKLTKQSIGVGVAGTGFIGPAHIEGLRRNGIQVLGLAEQNKEVAQQKAANSASRGIMVHWMKCLPPRYRRSASRHAEPFTSPTCQSRPAGWQTRCLRKTAGDDIRAIR